MKTAQSKAEYLEDKYSPFPFGEEFMVGRYMYSNFINDLINVHASISGIDFFIIEDNAPVWVGTEELSGTSYNSYLRAELDAQKLDFELASFSVDLFDDLDHNEKLSKLKNLFPDISPNHTTVERSRLSKLLSFCFSNSISVSWRNVAVNYRHEGGIELARSFSNFEDMLLSSTEQSFKIYLGV